MERLFVDTSAWIAHANRNDAEHAGVRDALRSFGGRLVTSNFVFDEVVTVARARLDHRTAVLLGELLRDPDVVDLLRLTAADEESAWRLFADRTDRADRADHSYSFTDCASFALMRRLRIDTALALDDDFAREGFLVLP